MAGQPVARVERRRKRVGAARRYLPTALFVATCIGLLLAATAWMVGSAPKTADTTTSPNQEPIDAPEPVAAVPPVPPAAPPPANTIRFRVQVVEPSYTVVAGDTLSSIAQRHGTTVDALQTINSLPDRSTLSIGQRLTIP